MFPLSKNFLIERSTIASSKNSAFLTDTHYYRLLDMINEESHARQKQSTAFEQYIQLSTGQLQNVQRIVMELKNEIMNAVTDSKEIKYLKSETDALKLENESLRAEINKLNVDVVQLKLDCNMTRNQADIIDKISKLEESKHTQYSSEIASVANKTILMENDIKLLNSRVDTITATDLARQDDFIALYKKTSLSELNAARKLHEVRYEQNISINKLSKELKIVSQNYTKAITVMNEKMQINQEAIRRMINVTHKGNDTSKNNRK